MWSSELADVSLIRGLLINTKENQIRTIELLAEHELAMGKLYRRFSESFPDYKDFWLRLSQEEISHAKCIRDLRSKIEEDIVYFNENRFQPAAIVHSLQYIEQIQREALLPNFSLIKALSIASFIEDALIEYKYFEVFKGDSPVLEKVLRVLADATNVHRDRVHKALAERKSQTP